MSHRYRGDDDTPAEYPPWLTALQRRLPAGASVLDLGCGCGIPVASNAGQRRPPGHRHRPQRGPDQPRPATRSQTTFLYADATRVAFTDRTFDAVSASTRSSTCRSMTQPRLISRIAAWLGPAAYCWPRPGPIGMDRNRGNWLGGSRHDVVEPRRRGHLPQVDHSGRSTRGFLPLDHPHGGVGASSATER